MVVCAIPLEDRLLGTCDRCNDVSPSSVLLRHFDDIDEDDAWSWSLWKAINKKVDLHEIRGTIASLLTEIDEQWPVFLLHSYCNREQRAFIDEIRTKSSNASFVVVQMGFAENYTFIRQREVQAAHWNNQQATLFTIHIKIGKSHSNIVIISDYMHHDTTFVYCAQRLVVEFVKNHFPEVKKIMYLRWASSETKNQMRKFRFFQRSRASALQKSLEHVQFDSSQRGFRHGSLLDVLRQRTW